MSLRPASSVPSVVSTLVVDQGDRLTLGDYLPLPHARFVRVMNPRTSGGAPAIGSIDPGVARSLARILRAHTSTPAECFFLVWQGYAGLRADLLPAVNVTLKPDRAMLVLCGDLDDAPKSLETPPFVRTAQWWLPADGAWLLGNDIYGASVYVAATEEVITAILEAEDVEAYPATGSMEIVGEEFED